MECHSAQWQNQGPYWLTLIIDLLPLPWFMIVCYFYISRQIHLVFPGHGWAEQTVNILSVRFGSPVSVH